MSRFLSSRAGRGSKSLEGLVLLLAMSIIGVDVALPSPLCETDGSGCRTGRQRITDSALLDPGADERPFLLSQAPSSGQPLRVYASGLLSSPIVIVPPVGRHVAWSADDRMAAGGRFDISYVTDGSKSNSLSRGSDGAEAAAGLPYIAVTSAFGTGKGPRAICAGDFAGDGSKGLAVANYLDGSVSIFRSDASGPGYRLIQTISVGKGPSAIVSADLNSDGLLDLAVANSGDGTVTVLLGNIGTPGTFTKVAAAIPVGSGPVALATADVNGDGLADIICANAGDNTITILEGEPSHPGQFGRRQTIAVGDMPDSLAVGNFAGTGATDIAVANYGDNTIWILTNNSAAPGTFTLPRYVSATGDGPTSIISEDFNEDGLLDLAVINSQDGTISILLADKSNRTVFPTQQIVTVGSRPISMTAGRFGPNKSIAVSDALDGTVDLLIVDESGRVKSDTVFDIGENLYQIVAGDTGEHSFSSLLMADDAANVVRALQIGWTPGPALISPDSSKENADIALAAQGGPKN